MYVRFYNSAIMTAIPDRVLGSFIDLSNHIPSRNREFAHRMSRADLDVILRIAEDLTNKPYDPLAVLDILQTEGHVSALICDDLKAMYGNGEDFRKIILKLSRYCSFESLVYGLHSCGYTEIAEHLENCRKGEGGLEHSTGHIMPKATGSHELALEFYAMLKGNVDNSTLKDKFAFFHAKAESFERELQTLDPESTQRKRCLLDKLMVVKCEFVGIITNSEIRAKALHDLKCNQTLRQTNVDVALYGKEACTYALKSNFEMAEELMLKARLKLVNFKASWLLYYHYLNEVFLKVAEFGKRPCNETKQSLLFYGFSGMNSLANENEDIQRMFKRMYISFMLNGLLCFGLFLEEIDFPITTGDRKLAYTLLAEFNRLSQGMETRRKMLYALFMSRIYEETDVKLALTYAKRAKILSREGELRTGEALNISRYVIKLTMKT